MRFLNKKGIACISVIILFSALERAIFTVSEMDIRVR